MVDSHNGVVGDAFIEPAHFSQFTACTSSYTLGQPPSAYLSYEIVTDSSECANKYEVTGIATGASNAEAIENANVFADLWNPGYCLQATAFFVRLSLVLFIYSRIRCLE
ncbi:hypothetical protein LOD99_9991 [Oopsacas minuta]|uniref:Uncharacterized protein n=1 Tax=Oopsacas minuta TaxID=111878 RepID=A0AAV7KJJ5_9METZ|nr:hypothetical protein LOD99_9991 [Oopsacas minuta]